jgi:iron-only hydrogenase group A
MCVVEVEGIERLVTSRSYPVSQGMKIHTHSSRVLKARKSLVELLISNHPDECLYCDRNGYCELQNLSKELNITERKVAGVKSKHKLDVSSPAIVREPAKCILCGRCVRTCDEIQSVSTLEFLKRGSKTIVGASMNQNLNLSSCIVCGQCIMACPTAALREKNSIDLIQDALNSKTKKMIAVIDPAVSVSLGEELGVKPNKDHFGLVVAALRKIGFDYVFDTSFAADLLVTEMVHEIRTRIETNRQLPLISSNCPAWVKYVEQFYPGILPHLSTLKVPQQAMGSIIKEYFASVANIAASSMFVASVTPCIAAKYQIHRVNTTTKGISEVDVAITTRELVKLIKLFGIDMQTINSQKADSPFGIRSTAGKLFAVSGGTTEAVARSLFFEMVGKEMPTAKIAELRSSSGIKNSEIVMGKRVFKARVCSGIKEAIDVIEAVIAGSNDSHFVEVMACPGGCVNGGGQPYNLKGKETKVRTKNIYEIDDAEPIKHAHKNPMLKNLYQNYLKNPGSEIVKKNLEVKFSKRDVLL